MIKIVVKFITKVLLCMMASPTVLIVVISPAAHKWLLRT